MSHEVTYTNNKSVNTQNKNILVDRKKLYKLELTKEVDNENVNYNLRVEDVNGALFDVKKLPHEVLTELHSMMSDSLTF